MSDVAIAYCFPLDDLKVFQPCAERWADTRRLYDPGASHDHHIIFCNGEPTDEHLEIFYDLKFESHVYNGPGWDIGTYQWIAKELIHYPFVVFMNGRTHFLRRGWLSRLLKARKEQFDENGLYGLSASYEHCPLPEVVRVMNTPINPHIRTACFSTRPATLARYPYTIDSRELGFQFESGLWNVSTWYEDMGYKVLMVTWDGAYAKADWRKPKNVFRKGDQSNLLVGDRHTFEYSQSTPAMQKRLCALADGVKEPEASRINLYSEVESSGGQFARGLSAVK